MVPDSPSSSHPPEEEKDILDLKANRPGETLDPVDAPLDAQAATEGPSYGADTGPATAAVVDDAVSGERLDEADRDTGTTEPYGPASRAVPDRRGGPATSTLIGTGILGGLVALLLAGSMQYAGYLPGTGDARSASGAGTEEVAALRSEIDGMKQQLATLPVDAAPDADVEKRLAALEASAAKAPGAADEARVKALEERVAALQNQSSEIRSTADQQVSELATRLAAAEKTLKDQPGEAALSKAIAATYLKAAVDRGDPFLTELQTFAALSPDDPAIAELKPLAATGVRSRAALAKDFDAAATTVLDAVDQPVQGEGLTDRLFASARSLISIRPVGNVEGTDTGAILARMEDKLRNGDIKGAALEWDGLPDPAKKASADFKAELDKRVKADELTRGLAERSATPAVNAG